MAQIQQESPMPKTPSIAALDLLKEFEQGPKGGFAAMPYFCPAGKKTIGYGHVIKPNEQILPPLSATQAEALLQADLAVFANGVAEQTHLIPLTQGMFDALCCFAFNIGVSNFSGSTLLSKLKSRDYYSASEEFRRWNKARDPKTRQLRALPGLTRRREAERNLFLRDGFPTA